MADVIGILTLLSKQVFWNWSGWEIMSRVLHNEKVRAISTLASGQGLLTVLKPTPLLLHAKMLLVPIRFFLLASRLCSGGFSVLTEQM